MSTEASDSLHPGIRGASLSASRKGAEDPTNIGRYQVISTLGTGGCGTVYACFDPLLERMVALKLLHPDLPQDAREMTLERFRLELRILGRVNHPHVVGVYDAWLEGERPYLVMEMCSGPTLAGWLSKQGRIPPGQAALIFHQAALALDHIHAMGIVHRDVKPANFLFQHKSLKLTDFGVAHLTTAPMVAEGLVGTPGYMSPEQFAGEPVTGRSDLFSLAALLFELLSGRPPFVGDPTSLLYARVFEKPPTLTDEAPDLPPDFDTFLARALARDPAERYESGAAMCVALSQIVPEHELEMVAGAAGTGLSLNIPAPVSYGYSQAPRATVAYLPSRPLREKPPPPVPERERISGAARAPWQRSEPTKVEPDILEFGETLRGGAPGAARLPAISRFRPKVIVEPPPSAYGEGAQSALSPMPVAESMPRVRELAPAKRSSRRWLLGAAISVVAALGVWGLGGSRGPATLASYSAALQPTGQAVASTVTGDPGERPSLHIQHHRPERVMAGVPLTLEAELIDSTGGASFTASLRGPDQRWHAISCRKTVDGRGQKLQFEVRPTTARLEYRLEAAGLQDGSSLIASYQIDVQPAP